MFYQEGHLFDMFARLQRFMQRVLVSYTDCKKKDYKKTEKYNKCTEKKQNKSALKATVNICIPTDGMCIYYFLTIKSHPVTNKRKTLKYSNIIKYIYKPKITCSARVFNMQINS